MEVNTNAILFQVISALLTWLLSEIYSREHHHRTMKIDSYVIITKLLSSILSKLPVFIHWRAIQTYWVSSSVGAIVHILNPNMKETSQVWPTVKPCPMQFYLVCLWLHRIVSNAMYGKTLITKNLNTCGCMRAVMCSTATGAGSISYPITAYMFNVQKVHILSEEGGSIHIHVRILHFSHRNW